MNQLEQMNQKLFEAQLLERELMRDLTDQELMIVFEHGKDYFITEYLGMDEAEYKGLLKITQLISAYCTKTYDEYEAVLNSGDLNIPLEALKTIVNDLESHIPCSNPYCPDKLQKAKCKGEVTCSVSKMPEGESVEPFDFSDMIPVNPLQQMIGDLFTDENRFWFERYMTLIGSVDPIANSLSQEDLAKVIKTPHLFFASIIDFIKDKVVDEYYNLLLKEKGVPYILEEEIVDEIVEQLWKKNTNIVIMTRNTNNPNMTEIVVK